MNDHLKGPKPQRYVVLPKGKTVTIAKSWWVKLADELRDSPFPRHNEGNKAEPLIDGKAALEAIANSIKGAKRYVWITDWDITPGLWMIRSGRTAQGNRLIDHIWNLTHAEQPVQVRIILYASPIGGFPLGDEGDESALQGSGARVIRHRPQPNDNWHSPVANRKTSHHQKTVVVDGEVAFLGGIDICEGRWDDPSHTLTMLDNSAPYDSYNSCRRDDYDLPRLPWHDVHLRLEGPAVRPVALNFVRRWNNHIEHPLGVFSEKEEKLSETEIPTQKKSGAQWVQVVRSMATLPGQQLERGCLEAFQRAIANAQHYVYIETQYFISRTPATWTLDKIENPIAKTIVARVGRAIDDEQRLRPKPKPFRVIVVLPVHPDGVLDRDDGVFNPPPCWRQLMLQLITLRYIRSEIELKLRDVASKHTVDDYFSVFCLRSFGELPSVLGPDRYDLPPGTGDVHRKRPHSPGTAVPLTEQIYVHAKLMIVDDNVAIIGSANMNDRSLMGNDTEIAALIVDESAPGTLAGNGARVRRFAQRFRTDLWKEHFGVVASDPVTAYDEIRKAAQANTKWYEDTFPNVPANRQRVFSRAMVSEPFKTNVPNPKRPPSLEKVHATLYPYETWLIDEHVDPQWYEGTIDHGTYGLRDEDRTPPIG